MRNGKQETIHGIRLSATLMGGWLRRVGLLCLVLAAAMASPLEQQQEPAPGCPISMEFAGPGDDEGG